MNRRVVPGSCKLSIARLDGWLATCGAHICELAEERTSRSYRRSSADRPNPLWCFLCATLYRAATALFCRARLDIDFKAMFVSKKSAPALAAIDRPASRDVLSSVGLRVIDSHSQHEKPLLQLACACFGPVSRRKFSVVSPIDFECVI